MLLRQQKIKNRAFSNPLSPSHQQAMSQRAREIIKVYEPKQKRLEKKIEA